MKDYAEQLRQEVQEVTAAWQQGHDAGCAAAQAETYAALPTEKLPPGVAMTMFSPEVQAYNSGWYAGYHDSYVDQENRAAA